MLRFFVYCFETMKYIDPFTRNNVFICKLLRSLYKNIECLLENVSRCRPDRTPESASPLTDGNRTNCVYYIINGTAGTSKSSVCVS